MGIYLIQFVARFLSFFCSSTRVKWPYFSLFIQSYNIIQFENFVFLRIIITKTSQYPTNGRTSTFQNIHYIRLYEYLFNSKMNVWNGHYHRCKLNFISLYTLQSIQRSKIRKKKNSPNIVSSTIRFAIFNKTGIIFI